MCNPLPNEHVAHDHGLAHLRRQCHGLEPVETTLGAERTHLQHVVRTRQHLLLAADHERDVRQLADALAGLVDGDRGHLADHVLAADHQRSAGVHDAVHVLHDHLAADQDLVHLDHPLVLVDHVVEGLLGRAHGWVFASHGHVRLLVDVREVEGYDSLVDHLVVLEGVDERRVSVLRDGVLGQAADAVHAGQPHLHREVGHLGEGHGGGQASDSDLVFGVVSGD